MQPQSKQACEPQSASSTVTSRNIAVTHTHGFPFGHMEALCACTCAMTSCDQMSEAEVMCFVLSDSEGLSRVGPNTVARLWRDILLMGSFSATLQEQPADTLVRKDDAQAQEATWCTEGFFLPFEVLQQSEEGHEVGVRQGAKEVHHAVLLSCWV